MPFRAILGGFSAHHEEVVRGVIFCDEEGERVESFVSDPGLDPFDLDIAGASFASLVPFIAGQDPNTLVRVMFDGNVTWVRLLKDGYYVLVLTSGGTGCDHAITQTIDALADGLVAHM